MTRSFIGIALSAPIWLMAVVIPASAYDLDTHAAITAKAIEAPVDGRVEASRVEDILKGLGFPEGVRTLFSDGNVTRRADQWLQEGSRLEDNPDTRVLRHFHNPLASGWDDAGLTWNGIKLGQSSALWQQNRSQCTARGAGKGSWSWPDAWQRYFEALTLPSEAARTIAFAKLFRSLGQVMHLVQDASVPAHTRNDQHFYKTVLGADLPWPDDYERWVDNHLGSDVLAAALEKPKRPSDGIFAHPPVLISRTDHPGAPAAVKYLIDSGRYHGTNPEVLAGTLIGLAEYSNGNFFSDSTMFADQVSGSSRIPFPAVTSVDLGPAEPVPGTSGRLRRYFLKVRDGETEIEDGANLSRPYRLAVPTALRQFLPDMLKNLKAGLDPAVLQDYARLLLPRAVGYSAALLDYFFRGQLKATLEVYKQDGQLYVNVTITNLTPDEDMLGTFEIYYDLSDGSRRLLKSWDLVLGRASSAIAQSPLLTITPVPADTPPTAWTLVFRGTLGAEEGAVAAARVGSTHLGALIQYSYDYSNAEDVVWDFSYVVGSGSWPYATYLFAAEGSRLTGVGSPAGFFPDITRIRGRSLFYLDPASRPDQVEIVPTPWTLCGGSDSVYYGYGPYRQFNFYEVLPNTPATGALVELAPPETLAELYGYSFLGAPAVRRVLRAAIGPYDSPFRVDVTGMRFLGLLLVSTPGEPRVPDGVGFSGIPYITSERGCGASVLVRPVE